MRNSGAPLLTLVWLAAALNLAGGAEPAVAKSESFDRNPNWEGFNNRVAPKEGHKVVQDFGYSHTRHAGTAAGEIGGRIARASQPAYYAARIGPKTLRDPLQASGTFALTATQPGGGIFFGFFRAEQPTAGGRPVSSIGLNLDTEHAGGRLAVRLINGANQSCGTFITPFIPGKFRPTPIRNDGTRYTWKLNYDPQAAEGRGRFTFELRSDAHHPGELENATLPASHRDEARRRFPSTNTFTVDLPEGFKEQDAIFDHFGLMNLTKPGGEMTIYFADLVFDGRREVFTRDPKWDGVGNRVRYNETEIAGIHDFGFSATNFAGGQTGELGGTFWRSGRYAYYADRVGPLTLADRLEASGKVVLKVGAPDADMYLGWFSSAEKDESPAEAGPFLGVHVGGPTRVGDYFAPAATIDQATRRRVKSGPVLEPGKVYEWSLVYEPAAESGAGAIRVTLGEQSVTLPMKNAPRGVSCATFDRFGVFTSPIGGQAVKLFLDDLRYTAAPPPR